MVDKISSDEGRPRGEEYDNEVDLLAYVLTLWRRKWLVAAGALACGCAALGLGLASVPTYEATVKLLVAPPKTAVAGETTPAISVATFRSLVENQTLASDVIREFKLADPPLRLTVASLLAGRIDVETVRDTNVVVLRVRMPDKELAANVANRLAGLAVSLASRMSQDEMVRARDYIKVQLDETQKRFDTAEARLRQFRETAQIEALRKDVDAQLGQRAGILPLLVEIQAEKARLERAEEQLAHRERLSTIKRTIDSDPALMEAAREKAGDPSGVLGLRVTNEFVNSVYDNLDQQIATSRTRLAALEKQRAELVDVRKLDASQLAVLNRLYAGETELARLQTEYDLAKDVYVDVSTRHEQARLQVAARTAQLQIMDSALPPDRPVGPKVARNAVAATVAGLILSALGVIFVDALAVAAGRARRTGAATTR